MKLLALLLSTSACLSFGHADSTGAPKLVHVLRANVTASAGINIGPLPEGNRTAYPITGGTFTGPKLKGTILPVGADFSVLTSGNLFSPDGISILQTDDGANILFTDQGFQLGKYVYGSVSLRTGAPKYSWLNTGVFVSKALVTTGSSSAGVALDIYQVGDGQD